MNEKIKEICSKCEYHIHCQGKGCAFRSLGNEYCDEVENANNLINDLKNKLKQKEKYRRKLQQRIDKAKIEISALMSRYFFEEDFYIEDTDLDKILKILESEPNDKTNKENN